MNELTVFPCPACNGPASAETEFGIAFVYCLGCGMRGPIGASIIAAIGKWNKLPRRNGKIPLDPISCCHCGKVFIPHHRRVAYCSVECRRAANIEKRKKDKRLARSGKC